MSAQPIDVSAQPIDVSAQPIDVSALSLSPGEWFETLDVTAETVSQAIDLLTTAAMISATGNNPLSKVE